VGPEEKVGKNFTSDKLIVAQEKVEKMNMTGKHSTKKCGELAASPI
jgi:hypothetical protein